ncbi:patatin-like protein [Ferrovibrio sp.]|uniref:patatin-like protein n=1 Tax=Ferrovibrio sp. TaxID=1917215 RepID=UPI001B6FE1CF|nr:patatin-like protein [Ferrovibrio sp.]MBP7063565.1 patatin-like protein [Ferrovibrio sp.]
MQEKELRLALVCFGGVSLAIYMHGVSKEILKLVRASKAFHTLPKGSRESLTYADTEAGQAHPHDTEAIYFELLRDLSRHVELRVIVDVIAGASAGGINGIMLARALAHDLRLNHFRDLWLKQADVSKLLDASKRAAPWSKWFMRPVLWLAARSRLGRLLADPEILAKVSLFTRSRWFEPPFDGLHLARKLFKGLEAMGEPAEPGASLMPAGLQLDLFVTVTDFYGYLRHIPIHDPPFVRDREHRHVLKFHYRRWQNGEESSDLTRADAAALAFAGRATSAFPGAFPPAQLSDIDQILAERGRQWEGKAAFLKRNFGEYIAAGLDPALTSFVDGGVLNNKPFASAMKAIRGRPAYRQVDRRLVYIDPAPLRPPPPPTGRVPGFFRTLKGALSDLPRNEPISDELIWVNRFNERVRHLRGIIDATQPQIARLVAEHAPPGRDEPLSEEQLRAWRLAASARAAHDAGFAYEGYIRLKLGAVQAFVAKQLAHICEHRDGSIEASWIALAFDRWAKIRQVCSTAAGYAPTSLASSRDALPPWVRFLLGFDVAFRQRRLRFLLQRLNLLYGKVGEPDQAGLDPVQLNQLKRLLYEELESLRRYDTGAFVAADSAALIRQLFQRRIEPQEPEKLARDAAEFADAHLHEIDAIVEHLNRDIALNAATNRLDALLATLHPADWSQAARRDILESYIGFAFWDVLTFTITNWRDLGEFNEIRIDRISPEDANAIRANNTLKGINFGRFGAFFSRPHRENDYLWGRLHAVERLIDIVCDSGLGEAPSKAAKVDRRAMKYRAFLIVLDAEAPHLRHSAALIEELRAEIAALQAAAGLRKGE